MTDTPKFQRRRQEHNHTAELRPKRPFKVGDPLEYRVSRLFIHLGYFVRRGREIYTVGRLDTATDLDVLAIRYADPLRREIQIAECKGGSDSPLDRVFWLSGVKRYVDASRATLIRPGTKWNIKDFATEVGIEILDLPRLEELEHSWSIDPSLWLGISDRDFFADKVEEWNRAIVRNQITMELYQTLAGEVRFHEPFGGINFLLHHLRALTRDLREQRYESESLTRFLLAEAVAQLAMFLMRITEMSLGLSKTDRDGLVRKGMTYGHMDKPFIDRIFRNAKQITTQMVKHHTGRDVNLDDTFFRMPEPPNIEGIQDIVSQLVSRPNLAVTLGPITDLLVCEKFLKQRDGVEWLSKLFPYTNVRERVSLVQEYLRILQDLEAIPDGLLGSKRTASSEQPNSDKPVDLSPSKSLAGSGQNSDTHTLEEQLPRATKLQNGGENKNVKNNEPSLFSKTVRFE
jgi:hypothetical protein